MGEGPEVVRSSHAGNNRLGHLLGADYHHFHEREVETPSLLTGSIGTTSQGLASHAMWLAPGISVPTCETRSSLQALILVQKTSNNTG
jgi:hypothetical protein